MASVSTYINTLGRTEEAFEFYRSVFGGEFTDVTRFRDLGDEAGPGVAGAAIMHIGLPILGGHLLQGTDVPPSMSAEFVAGTNMSISLHPDSREDADRLYLALSEGSTTGTGMADMPWGAYWGSLEDRFGIRWQINQAD